MPVATGGRHIFPNPNASGGIRKSDSSFVTARPNILPEQVLSKRAGGRRRDEARRGQVSDLNRYKRALRFPGFGLHEELALFVKAGFSPLEALQTATINPAKSLSLENSLGTVEKGKLAD